MRIRAESLVPIILVFFVGAAAPAQTITEFPLPSEAALPTRIVAGPDGNLWFIELRSSTPSTFELPTDLDYTLTVTDQGTGAVRTYRRGTPQGPETHVLPPKGDPIAASSSRWRTVAKTLAAPGRLKVAARDRRTGASSSGRRIRAPPEDDAPGIRCERPRSRD
jgi:hypothetical protein